MEIIQNIDDSILMFIQEHMVNPIGNIIMPIITSLGNAGAIWIIIAIALLFTNKYRKYGIIMAIALVLCLLIGNVAIKNIVARTRPFDVNTTVEIIIKKPTDYSFPSGHTMSSFAAAVVLYYMNKKVGIGAFVLAALIAFSRLYLYVHYPSDVLVGMITGILIGLISIKIVNINRFKKMFC